MKRYQLTTIICILCIIMYSCNSFGQEIFVTANSNLCPNCYNQYRMLDSIDEAIPIHLVFQKTNVKEARKFADKFFKIKRSFDIICNDSVFANFSHNIFPWIYYNKDRRLLLDAELGRSDKWIPIVKSLSKRKSIGQEIAQLSENMALSNDSRCVSLKENFIFLDFSYHELHLFGSNFQLLKTQDFSNSNIPAVYHSIFKDETTWQKVAQYANEIAPYIPDFGKIKIDNGCLFHDTLFLLVNVNYIETYFNERIQDSVVRAMNESAIISLDEQLNIQTIYPLRFRDSLRFDDFIANAYAYCVFQINSWDDIILSISQKEESEKHILCRMEKSNGEIRFKSLVDNAFIPEFNEKHQLGTKLCLIKADGQNAYFNAAPIITNYENGRILELPFNNDNAHFDLKHGIAEADYILADALQTATGDYLLLYYLESKNKVSLVDTTGSIVWTLHLPDNWSKAYLVDEKHLFFIDDDNHLFNAF